MTTGFNLHELQDIVGTLQDIFRKWSNHQPSDWWTAALRPAHTPPQREAHVCFFRAGTLSVLTWASHTVLFHINVQICSWSLLLAAHSLHSNIFMIYLFILYEILNVELWKRNKITDIIFLPTFHWTNDGKDDRRLCFVTRWFYLGVKRRLRSSTRNQQWISWSSLGNLDWHQHLSEYQCLGCRIWKN